MSRKPRCYLAGPMAGLSYEEANAWRDKVHVALSDDFELVNPCRNKESLAGRGKLTMHGYNDHFMCQEQTVFYRDTHDVRSCDGLLVNFENAPFISIGTPFELGMAWALHKPIIVVMPKDNCYRHIFTLQSANYVAETLEEAIMALRSIFNLL